MFHIRSSYKLSRRTIGGLRSIHPSPLGPSFASDASLSEGRGEPEVHILRGASVAFQRDDPWWEMERESKKVVLVGRHTEQVLQQLHAVQVCRCLSPSAGVNLQET